MGFSRGIEVGHVFKLLTSYSETFDATFLDTDGTQKPMVMGCYGIGVGRVLGAAIESNYDDRGIAFPRSIAPADVQLVALNLDREGVRETAETVYDALKAAGLETIYDDREESAGVKFADADLLGLPLRITVSPRNLREGNVELKLRLDDASEAQLAPVDAAGDKAVQLLG